NTAKELLSIQGDHADRQAVVISMTRDELGAVGPICGATLDVLLERVDGELSRHLETVAQEVHGGKSLQAQRRYQASNSGLVRRENSIEPADVEINQRRSSVKWQELGEMRIVSEYIPAPPNTTVGAA